MYILINKKTKKFVRFDNLEMKFIDVEDVFHARRYDCLIHLRLILKEFRVKSKYEIHTLEINHKKVIK